MSMFTLALCVALLGAPAPAQTSPAQVSSAQTSSAETSARHTLAEVTARTSPAEPATAGPSPDPAVPAPVVTAPTEPAPTGPPAAVPASIESAPNESAPNEPAPTDPPGSESAPNEPAPTESAPNESALTQPAPTEPPASTSAPNESAPTEPAPTRPPSTQPASSAAEGSGATTSTRAAVEPSNEDRRGLTLGAGLGLTNCLGGYCDDLLVGATGRVELGYRVHAVVAPFVGLSYGGGLARVDEDAVEERFAALDVGGRKGALSLFGADIGVALFPLIAGRFDPFVIAGIGYQRIGQTLESRMGSGEIESRMHSVAARTGLGLAVYVHEHVSVGPRFDLTIPFTGKVCATSTRAGGSGRDCFDLLTANQDARKVDNEHIRRQFWGKGTFPMTWMLGLDVRAVF